MAALEVIEAFIPCCPPRATAQSKRLRVGLGGQVHFFHGPGLEREAAEWAIHLVRLRPALPMTGPLGLSIRFVYPHPAKVSSSSRARLVRKVTRPDLDNAAKHLIDTLCRLRFLVDDAAVCRLVLEKWHGPAAEVGMRVRLEALTAGA